MKNKKLFLTIACVFILLCLIAGIYAITGIVTERKKTKILENLYVQCEKATEAHTAIIEIMSDVVSYEKAYVENPNWENLNNYRVAVNYAKTLLKSIPTDTLMLSDKQLDAGREIGFDISSFLNFCNSELEANKKSATTTITGRYMSLENFTIKSEFEDLKNTLIIDEKTVAWDMEYLILELQNFWVDFPEFGAKEKLSSKFPEIIKTDREWETDKELLLEKGDKHISKLEDLIAQQNRLLGNSQARLEIDKEQGFEANIITNIPAMVPDPFFSTDADKKITYKTGEDKEITSADIDDAVALAKKCIIVYENVPYKEYSDYIARMNLFDYPVKERKVQKVGEKESVIYSVADNEYLVRYDKETVTLVMESKDNMVIVPLWYMQEVSPGIFKTAKKENVKRTQQKSKLTASVYSLPEEDNSLIMLLWGNAVRVFNKKIAAAEKILEYEKAYIENPNAENLVKLQFAAHTGIAEVTSQQLPPTEIDEDIMDRMISKEAYKRAVENCSFIDTLLQFATSDRKMIIDDHLWSGAYYKDTQYLLKEEYSNIAAVVEECKKYISYTAELVSLNMGKEQRAYFKEELCRKYPGTISSVQISDDVQSGDFVLQSLEAVNYVYDKLLETGDNVKNLMNSYEEYIKEMKTVTASLGTERECFVTPDGVTPENAIPWIFSYTDAECRYKFSDSAKEKAFKELLWDDVVSYSITYPDKTYEDALVGISRLESKDIIVKVDEKQKTESYSRWYVENGGHTVICEWDGKNVTMHFPNNRIMIVPYGWYHYFRN